MCESRSVIFIYNDQKKSDDCFYGKKCSGRVLKREIKSSEHFVSLLEKRVKRTVGLADRKAASDFFICDGSQSGYAFPKNVVWSG